ncbi:LrgB family protein [Carboxylicivirga mesophila]|uniref:LrgB family protein n=1 Tax=Carboxylicivirga mesophila TaxID=1166478 RepID=A0ABS5KDN8_9BACT|nr:LrgB family protein [Carboxylicivirga mesophila]MBS2213148.1 LrgB family protein [Carboxylicivirga mesophila]
MIEALSNNHLFGILLTVGLFYGGMALRNHFRKNWINPLLISVFVIVLLLKLAQIPYEQYMQGAGIIHDFLGPVTVVLALPLYRQRRLLVKYKLAIISGIVSGVLASLVSVLLLGRVFGLNNMLERSLLPHSITTPIGIAVSNDISGMEGITVVSIILTGLIGASVAGVFFRLLRITHPVARGLALGTSAHAIGTSKAIELGETEGAVSSLSIGVAAITTVVLVAVMQMAGWY